MQSDEWLGFNEFVELYWLDKAQKALTPEHLKNWRDMVQTGWDIPGMVVSNMLPRLIEAYVNMLKEKIGVWDKFILNKPFLQLEYNDLGYIQNISLVPDAVDWVQKQLRIYVSNVMELENIWDDLIKWFWNSSVYRTLDEMFKKYSPEEQYRMSQQDWAGRYSKTLGNIDRDYFAYMFNYYTKHFAELLVDSLLFNKSSLLALEEFLGLKKYKTGLPTPFPAKILETRANYLTTFSMAYYQQLRKVMAAREFTHSKNCYPQAKLATASGIVYGKAVLKVEDSEQEQLCECLNKMNDETVDVLDILCHLWLKSATEQTMFVQVTADQILRLRGLLEQKNGQGKRGGYKREWKERIANHIKILHNTWLTMPQQGNKYYLNGSREIEQNEHKHRVIILADKDSQSANEFQWLYRPGDLLAAHLKGSWRQTALLSQKVLQLDPYRQVYEKRIARYFSWLWRSRQRKALYLEPIRIKTILDSIRMNYQNARAAKVIERFEKMMDTLLDLGIISAWQYDGLQEKWRDWLDCKIIVEPPAEIIQHYEKINSRSTKNRVTQKTGSHKLNEISPEAFRAERLRRKMTQMQAAEQIGVHQTTISKLENGYLPSDKKVIQKIRKWMSEGA